MKTTTFIPFIALLLCISIMSCSKDDDSDLAPVIVTAELFEDTSIMENSAPLEFQITFDNPAPANGFITLGVTGPIDANFETDPPVVDGEIEIPVQKGLSAASFEFSPQDNSVLEENMVITFELLDSSEEIVFGSNHISSIEVTDDEAPVTASFQHSSVSILENNSEGVEVRIVLSSPAPGEGSLLIELEGNSEDYFVHTYPALNSEQQIVVPVESGTLFTTFQVYPKDNALLQNHTNLKLKISQANGVVLKGGQSETNLLLLDDEILGKIKSVETVTNFGNRHKKTLNYATDGKINTVLWEKQPANIQEGTSTYQYENGQIKMVSEITGDWEHFIWQNGRVVQSEKIIGFTKVGYSNYEYNSSGQIQTKIVYTYVSNDGSYAPSARHGYEYHSNGDLKKESIYIRGNNNNWLFDNSIAFDSYTDKNNPAPAEIIPTQKMQQYLPLYYTTESNGVNVSGYYIYEYNGEGMVIKRISNTETITYSYY